MSILMLGGTGEASLFLSRISHFPIDIFYSLAFKQSFMASKKLENINSTANITIIRGGFSQIDSFYSSSNNDPKSSLRGLVFFIEKNGIDLILDFTHPYASKIQSTAIHAANLSKIEYWRLDREPWSPCSQDRWMMIDHWKELDDKLTAFVHPFFAIGMSFEHLLHYKKKHQHWFVRTLQRDPELKQHGITLIQSSALSDVEKSIELFDTLGIDCLVTKNSGGTATQAKLIAARLLNIPVIMLNRPKKQEIKPDKQFTNFDACLDHFCIFIKERGQTHVN